MSLHEHAYAVILAGGGGTRLWPKSRNETPKQFLKLTGSSTMMQVAAARVTQVVDWDHVIVVTNQQYREEVQAQLPQVLPENIIAEPQRRETAMAMLAGATLAYMRDPEAVIINSASDHVVTNEAEFTKVMKAALTVASDKEYLVAIGISPTFPSSGFGYIQIGQELRKVSQGLSLFKVENFTEKPNTATARAFIATGRYFWNANMYVWSAASLMKAFAEHQPAMHTVAQELAQLSVEEFHTALPAAYERVETISIDYAISEKVSNLTLIPGDFGWNDVGDWKVVYDLGTKDPAGNVLIGDAPDQKVLSINAQNNLIHTNGRMIALYGINDMIVIDTEEILMIVPKDQSQDVKKLVEKLKQDNQKEYL